MKKISVAMANFKNFLTRLCSKTNKKLFFTLLAVVIILAGAAVFLAAKGAEDNTVEIKTFEQEEILKQDVTLEAGEEFDITKIISNADLLGENYSVKIFLIDDEGKENEIALITKYYDADGNEVGKETAVAIAEDGKESLKEGFTQKQFLPKVGRYKIVIADKNGKKHETIVVVKDTTPPELVLQEVRIDKGTAISAANFVASCRDNSGKDCILSYVDESGNEIAEITGELGEHIIRIIAKDPSDNKTDVQEAKLIIEEPKPAASGSGNGGRSAGSGGGSTGAASSTSTAGYNNSNPYVAAALSLVGRKGMNCVDVVEYVLRATGKIDSVTAPEPFAIVSHFGPRNLAPNEVDIYSTHTLEGVGKLSGCTVVEGVHNTIRCETIDVAMIFHTSNNVITKVERKDPSDTRYPDSFVEYVNGVLGKTTYTPSYWRGQRFSSNGMKYGYSAQVPIGSMMAGDFMFWSPWNGRVSHWAIYIGNGKAVHGGWDSAGSVVIAGATSGVFPADRPAPVVWRVLK